MIRNYFKLILRNLRKRSLFTLINVAGLAIGLASVLVIVAYVRDELSYDKFHSKHDQLYRITLDWLDDGKRIHMAAAEAPLAEALRGKLAGVENIARVFPLPGLMSKGKEMKTRETRLCFADSVFFDLFDFKFIYGDRSSALDDPQALVITKSKAIEYFGTANVLGMDLHYENEYEAAVFHISGVIEDFPRQSHLKADFIASFSSLETIMPWYNSWFHPPMYTYLLARPGTNVADLERQINVEARKNHPQKVKDGDRSYVLQRISDIHLESDLAQEWETNSSITYIYLFSTIAIFVLAIAAINFMNLSTAQAATRAKEVGLRKVMGALRHQLVVQFVGEALLITIVAFLVGFALSEWVLLGGVNRMIGRDLSLDFLFSSYWSLVTVSAIILIGILSGLYPSLFLSQYKPIRTLKGLVDQPGRAISLRKGMVVFQFAISGILIIFTWIVLNQNAFMTNKDLGFEKEHVVAIRLNDEEVQQKYEVLKNSLLQSPQVSAVSLSSALPGDNQYYGFSVKPEFSENEIAMQTLGVDEDYLQTYGIKLTAGRDFSKSNKADENGAYIINTAAAESLGWDEPVGKELTFIRYSDVKEEKPGQVIGVVSDFHFQSLHHKVEPLLIYINRHQYYADYLSIRFKESTTIASIDILKEKWNEFVPDKPLEFSFIDDQLNQFYQGEIKRGKIFTTFAGLSIFISCLGLFGLATFSTQQRKKEIGIRKVLGASILSILANLSWQFIKLIVIASLIAWPIAWYASDAWLQNFAYHITPGANIFVLSMVGIAVIALMTITLQTFRASVVNPVESLRDE